MTGLPQTQQPQQIHSSGSSHSGDRASRAKRRDGIWGEGNATRRIAGGLGRPSIHTGRHVSLLAGQLPSSAECLWPVSRRTPPPAMNMRQPATCRHAVAARCRRPPANHCQRRRGLNLSHRATARGRCRTAACLYSTHETGEVVSTQATGTRQNVWDRWDVWKPHRIPSSVSRLKRQIGGWRHALGAASRCDAATLRRSVRLSTVSSARHEQAVCGMVCRRQKVSVDIAGPQCCSLAHTFSLRPSSIPVDQAWLI